MSIEKIIAIHQQATGDQGHPSPLALALAKTLAAVLAEPEIEVRPDLFVTAMANDGLPASAKVKVAATASSDAAVAYRAANSARQSFTRAQGHASSDKGLVKAFVLSEYVAWRDGERYGQCLTDQDFIEEMRCIYPDFVADDSTARRWFSALKKGR